MHPLSRTHARTHTHRYRESKKKKKKAVEIHLSVHSNFLGHSFCASCPPISPQAAGIAAHKMLEPSWSRQSEGPGNTHVKQTRGCLLSPSPPNSKHIQWEGGNPSTTETLCCCNPLHTHTHRHDVTPHLQVTLTQAYTYQFKWLCKMCTNVHGHCV